ncbi:MAG: glycosyltransferase family protein [Chitinispirillales bacterium]|nr:glycosyltransferase family protein [Chitinispirillales bacterium]
MNKKIKGVSVIVCSIDSARCEKLKDSVANTIGIDFEIIAFDNRLKNWGLCKVYNYCAEKAIYPYLCFIHEDVIIATENWGETLIEFSESTPDCGVVGIAGGIVAYRNFILWIDGWVENDARYRYWDPYNDGTQPEGTPVVYKNCNPDNVEFAKVITLDGCFLFVTRDVYAKKPFDEETFTGFHFYDADFTLGISRIKQNYVCYTIDIHHFSTGTTHNSDFCRSARKFQMKWKDVLPLSIGNAKIIPMRELCLASEFIGKCRRSKATGWVKAISHSIKLNGYMFFCKTAFYFCVRYISKKNKKLKKRKTV